MSGAIPQEQALVVQFAAIAGNEPASSFIELRVFDRDMRPAPELREFVPVRDLHGAAALVRRLAPENNVYVGAAPRVRESGGADAVERVWALWIDCDTDRAVQALQNFEPLPSIVVRSGTDGHRHAWWPLKRPVSPGHAVRANRRLALALGADRASTDAARIMRPVGSLNHKHEPARAVECVHLELDVFEVGDVVRGLSDDPAYLPRPAVRQTVVSDGSRVLAGLVRVVREAGAHERNNRLNWSAFRAGEHASEGIIDVAVAERELLAVAVEVGLGEREALRTIRSGLMARRAAA